MLTCGRRNLLRTTPLTALVVAFLFGVQARGEGVSCWIRCHCPPKIRSADDVTNSLRHSSNPPLNCLARTTGIFTTYLGKMLGIQGWRDYHLDARVSGRVVQGASSTDGLYTIDLEIESLTVSHRSVRLAQPSFIRVEVFPRARKGAAVPVPTGSNYCIAGRLMWDGDGFLEIHPQHPTDISSHKCEE
jgi:hypothetical protein